MDEQPIKLVEREAFYTRGGDLQGASTFNVKLPEISQVEVTNACNFTCDFCPRDKTGRPDVFMDPELAELIARRDLGGSHFVEFQLSGEPTLHRDLYRIIMAYKGKVMTGLSTNGSSLHAPRVLEALTALDYLTISIDSVEEYETVRPGGKWKRLVENIDRIVEEKENRNSKVSIDLQLIEFRGVERQRDLLLELVRQMKWTDHVTVRRVPDCFLSVTRDMRKIKSKDMCLNPWMSVSIHSDGDVVPCCFGFGKDVVYGNLREQSLEEIWNTSEVVKQFRMAHVAAQVEGGKIGIPFCDNCYQRSPVMLHWDLYTSTVKRRLLSNP